MSEADEESTADWRYAHTDTLDGALQRGRGEGVLMAMRDPAAAPEAVYACIRRDHRWYWVFDDRPDYLARLVRDLDLDPAPIGDQLRRAPDDLAQDLDNSFELATDVLAALGRGGEQRSVAMLRDYLTDGPHWLDVLRAVDEWPVEFWADLDELCLSRLSEADEDKLSWSCPTVMAHWAPRHPRLAAAAQRLGERRSARRPVDPMTDRSKDELVAMVTDPRAAWVDQGRALRALVRSGMPEADVLDLIEDGLHPSLLRTALREPGAAVVERARTWTLDHGTDLFWQGSMLLAEHGTAVDVPRLLEAWEWRWDSDDWCGFDRLADGFARLGPAAAAALPGLVRVWRWTPHSMERTAVLRALLAVDPGGAERVLTPALLDCEREVRELAAARVALRPRTATLLARLRDDPLETAEVRAAAASRTAQV